MDKIQNRDKEALPKTQDNSGDYRDFARPLTAKLLEAMELAKSYYSGEKDTLIYDRNGKPQKVLDLTGGYGANLLGHRHPRLLEVVKKWHLNGAPSLTQGSIRKASGLLAKKISDIMTRETSEGTWITTFSNSGTEAVEAALKHCLLHHKNKLVALGQEIEREMNQAIIKVNRSEPALKIRMVIKLRKELSLKISDLKMSDERKTYILHQLSNCHELEEMVSLIREVNTRQLAQKPKFLSLEKAYHGKTMGALSLTSNESFRNDFYLGNEFNDQTIFVSAHLDLQALDKVIDQQRQEILYLGLTSNGVSWTKQGFCLIAGAFAEPIQGEAGIVPVSDSFLAFLKKFSLQDDFLLVFDEIQTGMFRTGLLAAGNHSEITADIYTFSKSLGGGIAKIAATVVNKRKYIEEFGFLHTSTFCEDDFSSLIALEVFNILEGENSPLDEGMKNANYLRARLDWVKSQYPDVIKEVRGKGFLLAVEFSEETFSDMGFEFKAVCDARMQGYLLASGLLNQENLRMNPSLSNNLTLRIQPSLYFSIVQAEDLIGGLMRTCEAIKQKNSGYFLTSIYPGQPVENILSPDLTCKFEFGKRPLTVFLCHMIDENHIRSVTKALKKLPNSKLVEKLSLTKDIAEFEIYHAQTIVDALGNEMDIVMLGLPLTSEDLKKSFMSRNKHKVVQKVQRAIDYAKELGATTVGLGQFTSIVSGNGLYLDPRGMNLTTGNAYTISLTVQSALRSAKQKGINLERTTVALIGAAGNIMSVASSIMADHVGKLILIHHSPIEASLKYQEAVKRIISEIVASESKNELTSIVKSVWKEEMDILVFLSHPTIKQILEVTSDLNEVEKADIVMCGASSSTGFLTLEMFKKDAVIVDIAVPATIKKELVEELKIKRPDLTYHLGGIAQIPNEQKIGLILFPLQKNQSYACMAETFSIGFSGKKNFLNIGDLNKSIVMEVTEIANTAGFILGDTKLNSSL